MQEIGLVERGGKPLICDLGPNLQDFAIYKFTKTMENSLAFHNLVSQNTKSSVERFIFPGDSSTTQLNNSHLHTHRTHTYTHTHTHTTFPAVSGACSYHLSSSGTQKWWTGLCFAQRFVMWKFFVLHLCGCVAVWASKRGE